MNPNTDTHTVFNNWRSRIDTVLAQQLDRSDIPDSLQKAMAYAVLNGGKRLRPLLVYATGEMLGASLDVLDIPAAAVELIHAYSLIHDDLPAMDDAPLRRGKPACHKAFDEATAILAGDALQSLAFEILSDKTINPHSPDQRLEMITALAKACGPEGMAGGQMLDLISTAQSLTEKKITHMHALKTGALINASVQLGAIAASCKDKTYRDALTNFAHYFGLAFQVRDDILDVTGQTHTLGKQQGIDAQRNKSTFASTLGLNTAKTVLNELNQTTRDALKPFKNQENSLYKLTCLIFP